MRFAVVSSPSIDLERVQRYMPSNYVAIEADLSANPALGPDRAVLIVGNDNAGWTLDGYVIPRLASGMIYAKELTPDE